MHTCLPWKLTFCLLSTRQLHGLMESQLRRKSSFCYGSQSFTTTPESFQGEAEDYTARETRDTEDETAGNGETAEESTAKERSTLMR